MIRYLVVCREIVPNPGKQESVYAENNYRILETHTNADRNLSVCVTQTLTNFGNAPLFSLQVVVGVLNREPMSPLNKILDNLGS